MSDKAIRHRRATGRWLDLGPGLYAIAGSPSTFEQRTMAAVLSVAGSAASHRTAAFLLGLLDAQPPLVEVTVSHGTHYRARKGRLIRQAVVLEPSDIHIHRGVPMTTPTRTVVDLSRCLPARELEAVLDDALLRRVITLPRLRACLERTGLSRKGATRLKRLLDDRQFGVPESELERALLRVIRRFRLPRPKRQYRPNRQHRVDFAYPDLGIVVEVDGRRWHSSGVAFQSDRRRQNTIVLGRHLPLRFTWRDVRHEPEYVASTIRDAIALRRSESIVAPARAL